MATPNEVVLFVSNDRSSVEAGAITVQSIAANALSEYAISVIQNVANFQGCQIAALREKKLRYF